MRLALLLLPALGALAASSALASEATAPAVAAIGVIVGRTPGRSVAILQSGGRTRSVGIGEEAFGARVTGVFRDRVALDVGGEILELRLTTGKGASRVSRPVDSRPEAVAPPPGEAMGAGGGPHRRTLDRAEVERRLDEEIPRLMTAALRPYSEDGRVVGMRISRIPDGTLLQEVGIQSGDVITDINGVRTDSLAALAGLWSSLQGADELEATVRRDGVLVGLGVSIR